MDFHLQNSDYIELKNLLKITGLCESGSIAKAVIADGLVLVDGIVETRKGRKIRAGQSITLQGQTISVV